MPDYRSRQKSLWSKGRFLVTDRKDIFYYTGAMPTSSAYLLVSKGSVRLFATTVDNHLTSAKAEVVFVDKTESMAKFLKGRLGLDYSMPAWKLIKLKKIAKDAQFYDASKKIKEPRSVKDSWEIDRIKSAIRLAGRIQDSLDPWGKSEMEVALDIEIALLQSGSWKAFPVIVSSGKNSHIIHHTPGRDIVKADPTLVDMGAIIDGYHSDRTRVFLRGPTARQKAILEDVRQMQSSIIDFIEPGKSFKEVQVFWESLMKKKRYKVMHSFGHGIGLDIHEPLDIIVKGSVLTVEPGVYSRIHGGFRIEDVVAVGKAKAHIL